MFVIYVESSLLQDIRDGKLTNSENEKELANASSGSVHKTKPLKKAQYYKCNVCGKSFTLMASLKQHCLIHTGEKPFECEVCGKCFNKKGNVKKHSLIHLPKVSSNVQKLKCLECGKDFKSVSGLSRHKRINHIGNFKLHKCDLCDKEYFDKSYLKQHYMIHTGEKPFECENCGKRFNKKSLLVQHCKTHDSKEMLDCKTVVKSR